MKMRTARARWQHLGVRIPACAPALALALALALATAPAASQAPAGPPRVGPEHGSLVVVGGNMQDPEIYRRVIELAGGPDAPIVMIPTAGGGDGYDQFYQ